MRSTRLIAYQQGSELRIEHPERLAPLEALAELLFDATALSVPLSGVVVLLEYRVTAIELRRHIGGHLLQLIAGVAFGLSLTSRGVPPSDSRHGRPLREAEVDSHLAGSLAIRLDV